MRHVLLTLALILPASSPAVAQSCATMGGQVDCRAAAAKAPAMPPAKATPPTSAGEKAEMQGYSETTVSNHGVSTTLDNRVIDSHGVVEFGVRGSMGTPCRVPGYGSACE